MISPKQRILIRNLISLGKKKTEKWEWIVAMAIVADIPPDEWRAALKKEYEIGLRTLYETGDPKYADEIKWVLGLKQPKSIDDELEEHITRIKKIIKL